MAMSNGTKLKRYLAGYLLGFFLGWAIALCIALMQTVVGEDVTKNILIALGLCINATGFAFAIFTFSQNNRWNKIKAAQEICEQLNHKKWVKLKRTLISACMDLEEYRENQSVPLDPETLDDFLAKDKKADAVFVETIDHYEDLAIGIKRGIYDEETVEQHYRTVVIRNFENFGGYIVHRRGKAKQTSMYEHFLELAKQWKQKK